MSNKKNLLYFFSQYKEIRIPRIQRAYAQGRKNESFIRDSFLDDIFVALLDGNDLELNYVYGTNRNGVFELLDGQQRITTLFLLHWYIASREKRLDNELISALSKFKYETRHTSSDFCEALSSYTYQPIEGESPSLTIRRQFKWYFKSFDLDSTIDSMLRMIDAINLRYNKFEDVKLFDSLGHILFYTLDLDVFGLSEELYIKMNARGLPLTPFENFKADLIGFMRNSGEFDEIVSYNGHQMPCYLRIASELDGKWADIFWDNDDYLNIDKTEYDENNEDYSVKYFRFFYRYFAHTYILKYRPDIKSEPMRQDENYLFLHQLSEQQKLDNYFRFSLYKEMLSDHPDYILNMEKVLNTLYDKYYSEIRPLLTPSWGEDDKWDFYIPVIPNNPNGFTLQRRIVFSAISEFIEAYESFDFATFKKWMRVVWNIVNNTDIDSISPATYLERNLSSIIRGAAKSGEEFYYYLSRYNSKGDDEDNGGERSKSVSEEIIKARYIIQDDRWLPLFEKAEKHPFCKGMVRFFLRDESDDPERFDHRYAFVEQMFDANGVTTPFSQETDYILLRAMISCITNWNNIKNRYFTDKVEGKRNALKVMITTPANSGIREFLCDALDSESLNGVMNKLNEATRRSSNLDVSNIYDVSKERALTIHTLLYSDPKYMRWMQQHKATRIYKRDTWYYYAVEYGSSVNLLLLESDRDKYLNRLIEDEGFSIVNTQNNSLGKTKEDDYKDYGVYFGYNIHLKKEINGWNVWLVFSTACKLNVSVECTEPEKHLLTEVYGEEVVKAVEYSDPARQYIKTEIDYFPADSYDHIHQELFGEEGVLSKLPVLESKICQNEK